MLLKHCAFKLFLIRTLYLVLASCFVKNQMNEAAIVAVEERFIEIEAAKRNEPEPESSSDSLPHTIKTRHFEQVLGKISPSVSDEV